MKKDLVVFIDEVMRELLDSEIELFRILWEQYTKIEISEIESTEVGFYVNYELKHKEYKSPRIDPSQTTSTCKNRNKKTYQKNRE